MFVEMFTHSGAFVGMWRFSTQLLPVPVGRVHNSVKLQAKKNSKQLHLRYRRLFGRRGRVLGQS